MIKKIKLDTVQKATEFTSHALKFAGDITIKQGKYVVDGRSFLGIFSFDLFKPIIAEIEEQDSEIWDMLCSKYETKEK